MLKGTFEISSNVFQENVADVLGAAVVLPLRAAFIPPRTHTVTVFRNNTFTSNNCTAGGIVSTFNFPVYFQDTNIFVNNIGPCVQASETLIEVSGDMLWMNNNAPLDGGAVFLTSYAQLRLYPSANLTFVSNSGMLGSAIVADQVKSIPFLAKLPNNPLCFLIYSKGSRLPQDQEVSLSFINNTAQVGSALYLQYMEQCSFVGFEEPSPPLESIFRSDKFYYSGNENTGHSPDARGNTSYDISTPVELIDLPNSTVFAYAGEKMPVVIRGLDELGYPTAGIFGITERNMREFVLIPAARLILPSDHEYKMKYVPLHKATVNDTHKLTVRNFDARASASLTLIHKSCPAGFDTLKSIDPGHYVCWCSIMDLNILSCNRSSEDIMLKDWLWGTPITSSDGTKVLVTTGCSRGYCRCQLWYTGDKTECRFTVSQDLAQRDQQCTCNRQGFLCGSCVNGTGLTSLLNRCEACDTANVTLIALLVLVDAAFFLAILLYSLVKPIHLAAWWYPILFYIQVASYSTDNFPMMFAGFHNSMYCLGSLLGLYFPYDFCLYPNTTAVEVYAIKYIPFIVALVVCTVFGVLARCCIKDPKRLNFSGVWLIAMLLLNPAIHTSFSILQCPGVQREDGRWMTVWRYDGTVQCFTEDHLPLAIWALIVLAIYTLMVVVIPLFTILRNYRGRAGKRAMALAEVASHPYAPKYWWWFVVNYMRQLLIIFFAVYGPRTNVYETVLLMLFYFLYTYARPYKATIVNIIETALLAYLNLFLIMSRIQEHQAVYNIQLDEPSLDSCGNVMPSISPAWIVLGVFYFLPLTVLLFFLGRWLLCSRVVRLLRKKLCTRGGGVQEADPIHITYCTANWKNVTEATIDYVQHRGNGAEKLIL